MSTDVRTAAWQTVHDPTTTPQQLAALAAAHPEFAAAIAAHPQAYPELRAWAAAMQALPATATAATAAATRTPGPGTDGTRRPRPTRRLTAALIGSGLAIVIVGAGVGGWVLVRGAFGGASSPQAAVERAVGAAAAGDPMALLATLAPSELDAFRPAIETLAATRGEADADYLNLVKGIGEAGELRVEDVVYTTTEIADGVAVVTAVEGTITIDGDPDQLAEALIATGAETIRAVEGAGAGRSAEELETRLAEYRDQLAASLSEQLPLTLDIARSADEFTDTAGDVLSPWAVVTVDEGGWYVSPLLTVAEADLRSRYYGWAYSDESGLSDDELHALRPDEVPAAESFATPEEAAVGVADGFRRAATGDMNALAATLSLPERRLVALYAPFLFDEDWLWSNGPQFEFDSIELAVTTNGDVAEARIDDLTARYTDGGSSSGGGVIRVRGTCWEWTRDYGGWSGSACFSNWPGASLLDLDQAQVVFVKENGGWTLSPLRTAGRAAEQAALRVSDLAAQDRLADLWQSR